MNLCLEPKFLENLGHEVSCGHCRACRLKRKYEWVTRLVHEGHSWKWKVQYVTLTYNSENLPSNYSLNPKHLTDYFKRLRKALGKGRYRIGFDKVTEEPIYINFPIVKRIKYYACGEYGDQFGRPHYHALIYGVGKEHADVIYYCWRKCDKVGFKCETPRGADALGYVAGYCRKKLRKRYDGWYREAHGREPEFARQSCGLGRRWCESHAEQYTRQLTVFRNGKESFLPRYYRKILGITAEMLRHKIDSMLQESHDLWSTAYQKCKTSISTFSEFMQKQREYCDLRLKLKEEEYVFRKKGRQLCLQLG